MSGSITLLVPEPPRRPKPGLPEPEVAARMLLERFAALRVQHSFVPGDLVRYKAIFDDRDETARGQPMLVAGCSVQDVGAYVQPAAPHGFQAHRADIVLWVLLPKGGLAPHFTDRRLIEPWTPPEVPAAGTPPGPAAAPEHAA